MTRIPMTVDAAYLPEWGIQEGLRELVQNWLDACDIDSGADPEFADGELVLSNRGRLDRGALLLGCTTKADDEAQRGQFGEGLKLGALALVRAGCGVTIYTGEERWEARLECADDFGGRKILVWYVEEWETDGVEVHVDHLEADAWEACRRRFRCFADDEEVVACDYHGELLLAPEQRGHIYVKDILVASDQRLAFGYNLARVQTDRDRELVRSFDLGYAASALIARAHRDGVLSSSVVLDLLLRDVIDVAHFASHAYETNRRDLAGVWRDRYGDAVPCGNPEDQQRLTNLMFKGIVVPDTLLRVLERELGTVNDIIRERSREGKPARRLRKKERANLAWALEQWDAAIGAPVEVNVMTYPHCEDIGGMYRGPDKPIEVARRVLACRVQTLSVVIHEASHRLGQDGTRDHAECIEACWVALAKAWTGASS